MGNPRNPGNSPKKVMPRLMVKRKKTARNPRKVKRKKENLKTLLRSLKVKVPNLPSSLNLPKVPKLPSSANLRKKVKVPKVLNPNSSNPRKPRKRLNSSVNPARMLRVEKANSSESPKRKMEKVPKKLNSLPKNPRRARRKVKT